MTKLRNFMKLSISFVALTVMSVMFVACNALNSNRDNKPTEQQSTESKILCTVAYADAYTAEAVPFTVVNRETDTELPEREVSAIIKSRDEFIALSEEKGYPFFDENDESFDRNLSRAVRDYGNKFYQDKAIVFIVKAYSGVVALNVNSLQAEEGVLKVVLAKPQADGDESAVMSTCCLLLEVEKADVQNISEAQATVISKGTTGDYGKRNAYNEFYSLSYAYDRGFITAEQVKSIGYYHSGSGADYTPISKTPEALSAEVTEKIETDYAKFLNSALKYQYEKQGMSITADFVRRQDVTVSRYYGTYNGLIAVTVKKGDLALGVTSTVTVADTVFRYPDSSEAILLYQTGK